MATRRLGRAVPDHGFSSAGSAEPDVARLLAVPTATAGQRALYTVVAEPLRAAWRISVRELPTTWTVVFTSREIENAARIRIALDLGVDPSSFDVVIVG